MKIKVGDDEYSVRPLLEGISIEISNIKVYIEKSNDKIKISKYISGTCNEDTFMDSEIIWLGDKNKNNGL